MERRWEEYKKQCDERMIHVTEFSSSQAKFVPGDVIRSVTYTIIGFCRFLGINKSNFYQTYGNDPRYGDVVSRIKDDCEIDVREKFELGILNPKLAPLWMSKFGYSTKADQSLNADTKLSISVDYGEEPEK